MLPFKTTELLFREKSHCFVMTGRIIISRIRIHLHKEKVSQRLSPSRDVRMAPEPDATICWRGLMSSPAAGAELCPIIVVPPFFIKHIYISSLDTF